MEKLKKIYHVLLCFFIALTTMNFFVFKVDASTVTDISYTEYHHSGKAYAPDGSGRMGWFENQPIESIKVDGVQGFCIEPWVLVNGTTGYTPSTYENEIIKNIVYAGFILTNQTSLDVAMTQIMIWNTLGYYPKTDIPDFDQRKAQINEKIKKLWMKPSFDGQTITLDAGNSLTLTDTNQVLSSFNGGSEQIEGVNIKKEGNTLTILATREAKNGGVYKLSKLAKSMTGASLIHKKQGSQAIVVPLQNDSCTMKLNVNVNQYGSLKIAKQDKEGNYIPNTIFKVSYDKKMNNPIGEFKTGKDGSVVIDKLKPQTVYIQEITVPEPLVLDSSIHSIEIYENKIASYTATNDIQYGKITVSKEDKDTGKIAQGEAILEGVEFDVYNSDKSKIVEHLDKTNYTTKALPLGKYYVKESKAPNGYVLNKDFIPVELKYAGQNEKLTYTSVIVKDKVIEGKIEILKKVDYPLSNYPNEKFKFDIIFDKTNKVVDTLITDKNGYAISKSLPYGHYTIMEHEKEGYHIIKPIHVFINEESKIYHYDVLNNMKVTNLTIIKKDMDSKKEIPIRGIGFKLQKEDGTYFKVDGKDTFYTDNRGKVEIQSLMYNETYTIKEVSGSVPKKYALNLEGKTFTTNGESNIEIEFYNKKVEGYIQIEKIGEVLVDAIKDSDENISFKYEDRGMSNIEFEIYAEEDIYHPDQVSGLLYGKGQYITTLKTDENGRVRSNLLPLGKYRIKEKEAPFGFVRMEDVIIELKYKDEVNEMVCENIQLRNNRIKKEIMLNKLDHMNKKGLEGASFILYANQDIYSYEGKLLVKKGEKIETIRTDKKGKGVFLNELPLGKYYIKEVKAPNGYKLSNKIDYFDINEDSVLLNDKEIIEKDQIYNFEYENEKLPSVKTGDETNMGTLLMMLNASGIILLGSIFIIKGKMKKA